jgi:hypothetical protein
MMLTAETRERGEQFFVCREMPTDKKAPCGAILGCRLKGLWRIVVSRFFIKRIVLCDL